MNSIVYKKGNLFDVKDPIAILLHACNCKGVWGSGIAVEFKRRFPAAYKDYQRRCAVRGKKLLGVASLVFVLNPPQRVACLFTSNNYGPHKDPEKKILKNTDKAIENLFAFLKDGAEIHSPKINSGKFSVPWEKTAEIIENHLNRRDIKWTVWEFDPNNSK